MIERAWPYRSIWMQLNQITLEDLNLKEGYRISFYDCDDDMNAWANILYHTNEFASKDQAILYFKKHILKDGYDPKTHLMFVEYDHEKIATGMIYDDVFKDQVCPKLHYISVMNHHQKQGIGSFIINYLLKMSLRLYGQTPIYLKTQTWSYQALKLYQKFGFKIIQAYDEHQKQVPLIEIHHLIRSMDAQKNLRKGLTEPLTIGVVAPSSPAKESDLMSGVHQLKQLGFNIIIGKSCTNLPDRYLAAPDDVRVDDIHMMYQNPQVDIIMAMKGGYGTPRMIDQLNYEIIKKHPKPLIGFSDITLILNMIYLYTNQITYHGPMVVGDFTYGFNQLSYESFLDVLFYPNLTKTYVFQDAQVIKQGNAHGILLGGNLSLLNVMMHMVDVDVFKDKILLIEEVNEDVYRIDRMLQGLRLKGVFKVIKGLMIGSLSMPDEAHETKAKALFLDVFKDATFPILYDVPIGHLNKRLTIPIGCEVSIDTHQKTCIIHKRPTW